MRAAAQALRRRGERARLDPRRRPQLRGPRDPRPGPLRRDLPDRRRRREEQPRGAAAGPGADRAAGRRLRLRDRPRRPRPALRHRRHQAAHRAGLDAALHRVPRRPRGDHRLVPRARGLVAPAQGRRRGGVRGPGAVNAVIVGAGGQLGRALRREFPGAVALDRAALDVTDAAAVAAVDWTGVDVVLNAAAWTAVDAAEDPANLAAVRAANVDAVAHLARAADRAGAALVHLSSEYVFDGTHPGPIPEDLPPAPLSVYGRSKADGDARATAVERHWLVRTTWVVGEGGNFVRTMAALADRGVSPSVVDDQIGRPTSARDLAAGIRHLVVSGAPYGTYNLTGDGEPASWADVAALVFTARGRSADDVVRVSTAEYFAGRTGVAPRPLNSVLDLTRIRSTGFRPERWRDGLAQHLAGLS
ncbi:NAD-dependent epimerase/dehydratase family protein [Blastococcus sp. MG754426]|nr:NAD-dependent epimerase/dehydratase family protein [Blastococcus sp. MG754426]MCF6513936.1 NAD-dependent epimerase/dehydratase family protein [Blastococcus sp. MG754427]